MARLIRMDHTGHTTLAEWTQADPAATEAAVEAFRAELDAGYYAVVSEGEGRAECDPGEVTARSLIHQRAQQSRRRQHADQQRADIDGPPFAAGS